MTDRSVIAYPAILHFSESRHYIREVSPANTMACDSNEYAAGQDKNNGTASAGLRRELVKNAKERFNIEDHEFDVPKQTIFNQIKADRLTVFGPGSPSVVLPMDVGCNLKGSSVSTIV